MAKSAVANQKTVIIKKTPCTKDFLQIQNEEWQEAARLCKKPASFKIYLYLGANATGFDFLLSGAAIENALGFKSSAYYEGIKELKELGYIRDIGNNTYEFYTKIPNSAPKESSAVKENSGLKENNMNSAAKESSFPKENNGGVLNSAVKESSGAKESNVNVFDF